MSRLTLAVAAIAAAQPGHPSSPTDELAIARPLEDVPGIQFNYYDVNGSDVKAVNRSIKERRRAGSAETEWNVVVSLNKRTEGAACTITGSKVKFNATATLPRLTGAPADESLLMFWELYVAGIKEDLAAKLWFAYDRIEGIEHAFAGKPCDQGTRDGEAAIAQLKSEFASFSARSTPSAK